MVTNPFFRCARHFTRTRKRRDVSEQEMKAQDIGNKANNKAFPLIFFQGWRTEAFVNPFPVFFPFWRSICNSAWYDP